MAGEDRIDTGNWFLDLLFRSAPEPTDVKVDGTPEEMSRKAAMTAFEVSAAVSLVPGPVGMAAILPEVMALVRIQTELVYKIAKYHHTEEEVNTAILLLIFGNALGVAAGEAVVKRVGERIVVRALDTVIARRIARRIGASVVESALRKAAARWIPFVTAPLFGYFSRAMTMKVGKEADEIFSRGITIERLPQPAEATAM